MYGRLPLTHTYDHTRRSKDDILVYTENQLRNTLGNLERGKRVVVTQEIFITDTVEIKIKENNSTIKNAQASIICGFGSGKLTRKAGVEEPFDLFRIKAKNKKTPDESSGIHIKDLTFSGFTYAVVLGDKPVAPFFNSSAQYFKGLRITNCTLQYCWALIGGYRVSNSYNLRSSIDGLEVAGNRFYSTLNSAGTSRDCSIINRAPLSAGYYDTLNLFESYIGNNQVLDLDGDITTYTNESSIFFYGTNTEVVSNTVSGVIAISVYENLKLEGNSCNNLLLDNANSVAAAPNFVSVLGNYVDNTFIFNLVKSSIIGNIIKGPVFNNVNSEMLRVVGNQFEGLVTPNVFPNAACHIVRENFGSGGRDVDGYGRVSLGGEILGETVIDTLNASGTPFVWSTSSVILAQIVPVSVSFSVPGNKKVIIRLHCHVRDTSDPALPVLDEAEIHIRPPIGTFPSSICNDRQQFTMDETGFQPMTFEWYMDGTSNWTTGSQVVVNFWAKVTGLGMTMEFRAGADATNTVNAGPLTVIAEAINDDLNFIDASVAAMMAAKAAGKKPKEPLKDAGKKLP